MQVGAATFNRQAVADHASGLATKIRGNLTNSMSAIGVEILQGFGSLLVSNHPATPPLSLSLSLPRIE